MGYRLPLSFHDDSEFEPDYSISCPNCGRDIYEDVTQCPFCRQFIVDRRPSFWSSKPSWFRWGATAIIALTILAIALPWLITLIALIGLR